MDEGFAARNGDHRGSTFVGCRPTLLGRQAFVEDVIGVLDLTATSASEVAAEERFKHEDKRVPFVAAQFLPENIRSDRPSLTNWNWHKGRTKATNPTEDVNGTWKSWESA